MLAVSNTTPLRYLLAVGQESLFGQLFEKVLIPTAVYEELTDARTPSDVRLRILSAPSWFEVRHLREALGSSFPATLHRGEREAILLAETVRPDILLIDDQIGRTIALSRNLPVSGTLGLLERADSSGLIPNFAELLVRLRSAGFFISESLEKLLLRRHRNRRRS